MNNEQNKNKTFPISVNGKLYELDEPEPLGEKILTTIGVSSNDFFLAKVTRGQGTPEILIALDETIDIREPENREFNTVSKARRYSFRIDESPFDSDKRFLTGRELLALVGLSPEAHDISFQIIGKPDTYVDPDQQADLGLPGREQFFTEVKRPLKISIDGMTYIPGKLQMTGAELRALPTPPVPGDKDLWFDVPGLEDRLIPLSESVTLTDGMAFYTRASAQFSLTLVVSGVPTDTKTDPQAPLRTAAQKALSQTGNDSGRPVDEWILKDKDGTELDMSRSAASYGFVSGTKLYLSPQIGAGGCQ